MAKTYAIQRSTSEVVTFDTINNLVAPLGSALAGVPTAPVNYPAEIQNSEITFLGDPYVITPTTSGSIQVLRYNGSSWVSSLSLAPSVVALTLASVVGTFVPGGSVTQGAASGTIADVATVLTFTTATGAFISGPILDITSSGTATATIQSGTTLSISSVVGSFNIGDAIAQGANTTLAIGSNGFSLPQPMIYVASTAGFPPTGTVSVTTGAGPQVVTYTGLAAGSFTGCSGGVGVMSTGGVVRQTTGAIVNIQTVITVNVLAGVFSMIGTITQSVPLATATASQVVQGTQMPTCLHIVNNTLVAIWNESSGAFSKMVASTTVDGITWTARTSTATSATLAGSFGGASAVWAGAVFFATALGIGNFVPGLGFGAIDSGFDISTPNPLTEASPPHPTPQGSLAYWNGTFYFVKPATASSPPILFSLPQNWVFGAPVPQWATISGVTGIQTSGSMIVSGDIGNYCLFVNKVNQLCLMHSGQSSTKLAVSTVATFPAFSDVSANQLPPTIASKPNLGVSIFIDTRRRLNELQWFFVRDSSVTGNSTTLCSWDGINQMLVQNIFPGQDYLLTSDRLGHIRTYTAVQPGDYIADVLVSQAQVNRVYVSISSGVGTFNPGDPFVIPSSGPVAASGTIEAVSGSVLRLNVTFGTVPGATTIKDTTTLATASILGNPIKVSAFPGRAVIAYILRDTLSRNMDVFGEYSIVGDKWLPMTEGAGDDGSQSIAASPTGTLHVFYWDAFADLNGNYSNLELRIVSRISTSALQAPVNPFVPIVQEGYLRPPVTRLVSQLSLPFTAPPIGHAFYVGETVTGGTSGATGVVQYQSNTNIVVTGVVRGLGSVQIVDPDTQEIVGRPAFNPGETITGSNAPPHSAVISSLVPIIGNDFYANTLVSVATLPADETTDVEEFNQATYVVPASYLTAVTDTRAHAQFVFQGRLSTNQTRIRFLKLILRGSSITGNAQISVYVSGQGGVNQYLAGRPFSTFQALSTADQEVIISDVDLSNQPSVLGKKYSVVVEFDLDAGQSGVVSTPFFRHE